VYIFPVNLIFEMFPAYSNRACCLNVQPTPEKRERI
jgi:hypothetical protein